MFKVASRFDKVSIFYATNPFVSGSFYVKPDHKTAKPHRVMFVQYFSETAVYRIEHLIHEQIVKFLDVIRGAAKEKRVLNMTVGFKALTSDIVMHYCYQKTFGTLDAPEFRFKPLLALEDCFSCKLSSEVHMPKC